MQKKLDVSVEIVEAIVQGRIPVTVDMAIRLGKALGNGPQLWLNLQHKVDIWDTIREKAEERCMNENKQEMITLGLDTSERGLIDIVSGYKPDDWHPANGCSNRLIKCKEALQDIYEILDSYFLVNELDRRKRKIKAIFVPLHSLCEGITRLIDQIQSEKQIHSGLPEGTTKQLTQLRTMFVGLVPFDRNSKLGKIRNKMTAHYEKDMFPSEMNELYEQVDLTEIGEWIHTAIVVLCTLMKLDAYIWSADGPIENTAIFMFQYPYITLFQVVNKSTETESVKTGIPLSVKILSSPDPRNIIFETLQKVTKKSLVLFEKDSRFKISELNFNEPINWEQIMSILQ